MPETKTGTHWTAEQDAILIKLSRQGGNATEIAEAVGRSPKAVQSRRNTLRRSGVDIPSLDGSWHSKEARERAVATCLAGLAKAKSQAAPAPRGYSAKAAAWALANAGSDPEASLIVVHLAESGNAVAQGLIGRRAVA